MWFWDSWPVADGDDRHLFYLQAPRSLGDPNDRHFNASIGHAVSPDWQSWTILPDALAAAPSPAWDDMAVWTGSVVRDDHGRWRLFYTAVSHRESGRVQRIGHAESDDLITWKRTSTEPLLCADPRWYETLDRMDWREEAWRDPWVFRDPDGDGWHMLITARALTGPRFGRGVIGHARSADLDHWEVQPPFTDTAGFGQMEVAQVKLIDGHAVLTFCCLAQDLSAERRQATPVVGMWSAPGESLLGPFDVAAARPFDDPSIYAGHLVDLVNGGPGLLGFADDRGHSTFDGAIPPPARIVLRTDGTVTQALPSSTRG
jgi:beta-fructofuranosidase